MTTIAIDENSISGDSMSTCQDTIVSNSIKKVYKKDGVIYAFAGVLEHCEDLAMFISGESDNVGRDSIDGNVVTIDKDGEIRIHWIQDGVYDSGKKTPPFAIGSGGDYALSAMKLGLTSRQAVDHAKKIDLHTGGKITTIKYNMG